MKLDIFLLIILIGTVISFFSALGALMDEMTKEEKCGTVLLFFAIGMKQINYLIWYSGLEEEFLILHSVDLPFVCCIGPLLFLYLNLIIGKDSPSTLRSYLPFVPAVISGLIMIPYIMLSDSAKLLVIQELNEGVQSFGYAFFLLTVRLVIFIQTTIYLGYFMYKTSSLVSLRSFVREKLILHLFLIIIFTITIMVLGLYGQLFLDYEPLTQLHKVMTVLITFLLIYLHLLVRKYPRSAIKVNDEYQRVKYENSNLKNVDLNLLEKKLKYLLEEEKIYSDHELNLEKFANKMDIKIHQLSQYINEILKMNFYDLINNYRISESEKILVTFPERTVLSIALEVGFSSLSTFYSSFKKKWNMSPLKFRENHLKENKKNKIQLLVNNKLITGK